MCAKLTITYDHREDVMVKSNSWKILILINQLVYLFIYVDPVSCTVCEYNFFMHVYVRPCVRRVFVCVYYNLWRKD